ncbi:MAG: two-component system sensor histidine kinase NtrB [Rectinemataceae bacterium]
MRPFVERALAKAPRMNADQLRALLRDLASENGKLEAALDSMLDGIVVCDSKNLPSIWNKSAERMLGLSSGEAPERPLWFGLRDPVFAAFLKSTFEGEDTVLDREFELDAPAGRSMLVAASVTPLVSNHRIVGTLIHLEDITDKRRREAQFRRAESLASLTTLAAGVAHEIKNPLGSISIHIQLLQKALRRQYDVIGGNCDESVFASAADRHLGVVTEEIERLNKIVVDFLFAVRPMELQLRDTDPSVFLHELADFIAPEAEQAGVELVMAIPQNAPRVLLDTRYMKQAILNLAKNALAAMPLGGKLSFALLSSEEWVRFIVADSGQGMAPEVLAKIFEPYYTTKETGTGLGLTITFKIVREHRGEITVDSRPGEGAAFTISIPVPQRERKFLPSPAQEGDHAKAIN